MTEAFQPRLVDAPPPRLGARRRAVLERLRAAGRDVSVEQMAEATGLHANTARFHLDALVGDGLAGRSVERRSTPGRRRVLYAARTTAGERSYGLLAEMLTGIVEGLPDARGAAVEAGRTWGRSLVRDRGVADPVGGAGPAAGVVDPAAGAVERLREVFDEVGFAPELEPHAGGVTDIHLRHCPFVEVAARHTEVVCSLHLGLMTGVLEEADGGVEAESLIPFVSPHRCVARVRAEAQASPEGAEETRPIRTRHTSGPSSR